MIGRLPYLFGAGYVGALSSLYFFQTKKTIVEWRKYNERIQRIQRLEEPRANSVANGKWN
jgi:hypothetical protein